MANIKVSELPTATSFEDDDYVMIVQSNTNKKITKENMYGNYKYSTIEKIIGKWIDGKPIYRKIIITTSPNSIGSWTAVGVVDNIDVLINLYGSIAGADGRLLSINHPEPNYQVVTSIKNNNVEMFLFNSIFENLDCYIIVEYTKTTD